MGLSIDVTIDDREVKKLLDRKMAKARDLKPAFRSIGEYMAREREELFRDEKDPGGKSWAPLKTRTYHSSYRKQKRTKKGSKTKGFQTFLARKKILTRDHHLRRTVYKAGSGLVVVSPGKTSKDYAAIHQFGGKAGRGKKAVIPARPHLGINDENRREFIEIIKEHLDVG